MQAIGIVTIGLLFCVAVWAIVRGGNNKEAPSPLMGETAMGFAARTGQLPSQQLQECQIDAITTAHDSVCPCSAYGNPLCPLSSNKS